jgi:hypothetical protein
MTTSSSGDRAEGDRLAFRKETVPSGVLSVCRRVASGHRVE